MQIKAYIRVLIVLFYVWFSLALAPSQSIDKNIHIPSQTATTAALLEQISQQCQCYFAYPSDLVQKNKEHTIERYNGPIEPFIRTLFPDSISFEYYKNQVILKGLNTKPIKTIQKEENIIKLAGILKDKQTEKAIPYASISIHGSSVGTISNTDGQFQLKLPPHLKDSTIQISCLGYYTHSLLPSEFKNEGIIYLSIANISLQEVIVRSVGTSYIIQQTKRTLDKHYRRTPYSYKAFYRELAMKRNEYVSYNEALFQGYSPKGSRANDHLILKKARQYTQNEYRDTIQLKLKGGTDAALQLDIANFKPDFLAQDSEQHYRYRLNDLLMWHDEMVYVITFAPLVNNEDAIFKGELYISFTDFSLLGATFSYTKQHLNEMKDALIVKKANKTKVHAAAYTYHVEYQKLNNKYHINYVKGDIIIKAKRKKQLRYTPYNTTFEMTLTAVDTTAISPKKRRNTYRTNSIFSEQIKFNSEEFWQYNNLIVPETEIMKAFYESGFSLEEQATNTQENDVR